jgi:hypothetical protein
LGYAGYRPFFSGYRYSTMFGPAAGYGSDCCPQPSFFNPGCSTCTPAAPGMFVPGAPAPGVIAPGAIPPGAYPSQSFPSETTPPAILAPGAQPPATFAPGEDPGTFQPPRETTPQTFADPEETTEPSLEFLPDLPMQDELTPGPDASRRSIFRSSIRTAPRVRRTPAPSRDGAPAPHNNEWIPFKRQPHVAAR